MQWMLTSIKIPSHGSTPSIILREDRSLQKSLWEGREEAKFLWYKGILKLDVVKRDLVMN